MSNRKMNQEALILSLKQLILRIKKEIEIALSKNLIQPNIESYLKWKINNYKYTKEGVSKSSANGTTLTKESWFRAQITIEEIIRKSDEYKSSLIMLNKIINENNKSQRYLEYFSRKIISIYLNNLGAKDSETNIIITNFIKDINNEPVIYRSEVQLDGIVVFPKNIELKIRDTNINLRQITVEDLEKPIKINILNSNPLLREPTAILNIEIIGRESPEIQRIIEEAITILRLFKVGSVKYFSYTLHSESIIYMMGDSRITSSKEYKSLEKSIITEEDINNLITFWRKMSEILPSNFLKIDRNKIDFLSISYERYCDALFHNGVVERRIANAMMGLESLFLKGGEIQELSYRLKTRISKILYLIGFNPNNIKEIIGTAYKIRSLFVHGGHLNYKEKKKLISKFKDIKEFLKTLLDYLRISIIIGICINIEKDEFLDLIDDALIDKAKEDQLINLLNRVSDVIFI